MRIIEQDGKFRVRHSSRIVKGLTYRGVYQPAGPFDTEREAEKWADDWIDDQVFDGPNDFCPPLEYEETTQ